MATAIIVAQIPGASLDPDAVETAAADLKTQAGLVRDAGTDVKTTWSGLTYAYTAPESATLLSVMDPVATDTDKFADDLERVSAALSTFAADLRVIKSALDSVRSDATAFHRTISGDDEWNQNQDHIDTNNALRGRVAAEQVRLWEAERTCANSIRTIDCIAPWHASTGEDDGFSYGYDEIGADAEMPWGAAVQREDECPKSAAVGVKRFVWDGIVVDIVGEGLLGIGGLVGLGMDGWSLETLSGTWSGLGALIGRDPTTGEWAWGTAGDAWVGTGKSLLAWDMWAEDPARAAGTVVGNVLLTVFTLGAGTAVKGVSTAGRTGTVLANTSRTVSVINKLIDPIELARGAAAVLKGVDLKTLTAALSDSMAGLGTTLKTTLRGVDVDVQVDLPNASRADAPGIRESNPAPYDGLDRVEGNRSPASEVNSPHHRELFNDNPTSVRVPEPEYAHAGGQGTTHAPGGGDGGGGSASHGGSGGDGGSSGGNGGPHPGDSPAPGADGTGPGNVPDKTPVVADSSPMGKQVADQPSYLDVLDGQLSQHGLTEPQLRDLVNTPLDQLSKSQVETLIAIREGLPGIEAQTVLQKIVQPDVVVKLFMDLETSLDLSTPQGRLDKAALDLLRQEHADVFAAAASKYEINAVTGFVSRTADVNDLGTEAMYRSLGLDYSNSPFALDGEPRPDQTMFGIEFTAGNQLPSRADYTINTINTHFDELQGLSRADYETRLTELVEQDFLSENPGPLSKPQSDELADRIKHVAFACDIHNPHRGNGFGGSPTSRDYTPELQFSNLVKLEPGAELWKIAPDGERVPVAFFDGQKWSLL